jgi:hypothetical protein
VWELYIGVLRSIAVRMLKRIVVLQVQQHIEVPLSSHCIGVQLERQYIVAQMC